MSILFKSAPLGELVDADEKKGIVKGYASYFNNKDSDSDIIRPGAYAKTIKETDTALNTYTSTIWRSH